MTETLRRQILRCIRDLPEEDCRKTLWFSVGTHNFEYYIRLNSGLNDRLFKCIKFTTYENRPTLALCLKQFQFPREIIRKIIWFYSRTENIKSRVDVMLVLYNKTLNDIELNSM